MAMTTREERRERRFIDEEKARITPEEQQEIDAFMEELRESHPDLAYVIGNENSRNDNEEEGSQAVLQAAQTGGD